MTARTRRAARIGRAFSAFGLTQRGRIFITLAVVAFIAAYATANQELLLAGCLLACLLIASAVIVRVRRLRLGAVRSFSPRIVEAGGSTTVTIRVHNQRAAASSEATWQDRLPWAPWLSDDGRLPPLAPAGVRFSKRGNGAEVSYVVRPPRRGIVEIGPLEVSQGDPFGIVRGDASLAGTDRLIVTPRLVELHDSGLTIAAGEGSARLVQRSSSGNDDDLMTREYRRGDALRRVHWRASARHGELMVRQEEQRSRPEVRIILDTRRGGYSDYLYSSDNTAPESETFEWAVSMVASIGTHLHRSGFLVDIIETAHPQITPFEAGNQRAVRDEGFLASLAGIRLVDSASVAGRLPTIAETSTGGGPVFAIVGSPDHETVEWLARQRRPLERATVILPAWAVAANDDLTRAGWHCVRVGETDDAASIWASLGALVGRQ